MMNSSSNLPTQSSVSNLNRRKNSNRNKMAALATAEGTNAMKRIEGRLYLCTKSIVFEPADMSRGIIRYPFERMIVGPSISPQSSYSAAHSMNNVHQNRQHQYYGQQQQHQIQQEKECKTISFSTTKYIIMKKNNIIAPYTIIDETSNEAQIIGNFNNGNGNVNGHSSDKPTANTTTFSFTFLFSKPDHFLELCRSLFQQNPKLQNLGATIPSPSPSMQEMNNSNNRMAMNHAATVHKFNIHNFVHLTETPQTTSLKSYMLSPLISKPGCTMVTQEYFYFQPIVGIDGAAASGEDPTNSYGISSGGSVSSGNAGNSTRVFSWKLSSIVATARRYHGLKDCALELFFSEHESDDILHDNDDNLGTMHQDSGSSRSMVKKKKSKSKKKKREKYGYSDENGSTNASVTSSNTDSSCHSSSLLIAFETKKDREMVMKVLPRYRYINDAASEAKASIDGNNQSGGSPIGHDYAKRSSSAKSQAKILCHTDASFLKQAMQLWMKGGISNFDYLLVLNSAAGRSFHDLSRYPVFPWVLNDYESSKLDLKSLSPPTERDRSGVNDKGSQIFRDLAKPIGALNNERLEQFKQRWSSMHDMEDVASFLYGTHYSAPGYCLYYLVRLMPEHMLCLQNGKYDAADRLFHSIQHCYSSLLSNPTDLKESIPQFYDPQSGVDLLLNLSGLQLGVAQNGTIINDVELPNWAKSPKDFLKKNRRALESDYCSYYLPDWIDLIFGDKSRGAKAEEAMNIFHPTSYYTPKDVERMESEEKKAQAELQATEFGICCDMLFCAPHPHKNDNPKVIDAARLFNLNNDRALDPDVDTDENARGEWELLPSYEESEQRSNDEKQILKSCSSGSGFTKSNSFEGKQNIIITSSHEENDQSTLINSDVATSEGFSDQQQWAQNQKEILKVEVSNEKFYSVRDNHSGERLKRIPLSGSGDTRSSDERTSLWNDGSFGASSNQADAKKITHSTLVPRASPISSFEKNSHSMKQGGWELKLITSKEIHSDTVSGCHINIGRRNSNIITTSLDGSLVVHILPTTLAEEQSIGRRGFSTTAKSLMSQYSYGQQSAVSTSSGENSKRIHLFRSHTSSDPLSCLAVVNGDEDASASQIAFAGGHDDVILAYGVHAACGLASIYSHRDCITGIDICPLRCHGLDASKGPGTHVMISGSYDATVKLWNVSIAKGENVIIDKEPLVELFDAESSVSDVAGKVISQNNGKRLLVAAGAQDGSITIWSWDGSRKNVQYREETKRGFGSCSALKWSSSGNFRDDERETILLIAGFGNGRIASYVLKEEKFYPVGILDVGSPVNCLSINNNTVVVGCEDGGIRLTSFGTDGHLDYQPRIFSSANGPNCPAITSIHCANFLLDNTEPTSKNSKSSGGNRMKYLCCTGGKDGTVSVFHLDEL